MPALTKDGLMLPVTALTKVLPSLISGIQIVAFIAKFSETNEEEENRLTHYLLYRTDTEQVMGVSAGCQTSFGISPMLIYGHPLNVNTELMIHHLFGVSFEKNNDGRIAASLEVGEIFMNLNTKHLG